MRPYRKGIKIDTTTDWNRNDIGNILGDFIIYAVTDGVIKFKLELSDEWIELSLNSKEELFCMPLIISSDTTCELYAMANY